MENFIKVRLRAYFRQGLWIGGSILLLMIVGNYVVMPLYVNSKETVKVPDWMGMSLDSVQINMDQLGLNPVVTVGPFDPKAQPNTVFFQNPLAGTEVKLGRNIYLSVTATEPRQVEVPVLRDRSEREALILIERSRLKKGGVVYQISENVPENVVIGQTIAAGKQVAEGTAVTLIVSKGAVRNFVSVPALINLSMNDAQKLLIQQGLSLGSITNQYSEEWLPNTIVDQYPKSGEQVALGRSIDLWVTTRNKKDTSGGGGD